jgi:hypothetical protein
LQVFLAQADLTGFCLWWTARLPTGRWVEHQLMRILTNLSDLDSIAYSVKMPGGMSARDSAPSLVIR